MQRFFDVVQDRSGNAIPGALVYVYTSGGGLATLYSDNGVTTTPNPVTTNFDGEYGFYAANGTYSLTITASGYTSDSRPGVVIFDPADGGVGVFVQAGTGAVTRVAQNKMRESFSVKDFGAVGDGVTDDSAAIQIAINALPSGGTLVFPFGTYKVNTSIEIQVSNITLLGNGSTIDATTLAYNAAVRGSGAVFRFTTPNPTNTTTLASTAAAGATTLTLTSATNAAIGKLIRCYSNQVQYRNSTAIAYYNDQNKIVNVVGSTVTLESPLQYPLTVSPSVVSVSFYTPISNIFVDGFKMLGGGVRQNPLANGLGPCGIWGAGVENINVTNCKFYGFQGIAVGVDVTRDFTVSDCYFEGIDANTVIVEGQNSSFYAAYAIRARRVLFTRCIGQRVRHLFDAAEVYQIVQSDSTVNNTHRGAFGSHEEVYDLNIVGNVSYDCYAGVVLRALTANVTGNTFTAGNTNDLGITTPEMVNTDPGRARYLISSNRLYSMASGTGAVNLDCCSDQLTITANLFVGANPSVRFNGDSASFENTIITNNTFIFESPGAGATAIGTVSTSGITGAFRGLLIANNTANGYTGNMISLHGCASVTAPADCFKITDNLGIAASGGSPGNGIILRNTGYYGENIVIRGNSQWNDTSDTVSVCPGETYRIKAYPIVELNDETTKTNNGNRTVFAATSSSPTELSNATLLDNFVIENKAAVAGGPNYWVVTVPGTNGTITGVTGTIAAGSTTLALFGNDATKVYSGCYIGITGSGLGRVRVNSISSDFATATLSDPAVSDATLQTVSRTAPTIVAGANLV